MKKKIDYQWFTNDQVGELRQTYKERFGTVREVSAITGLAEQTLANQRFNGKGIPYHKVGRAVRYYLPEVFEYMARHRVEVEPN